MTHDDDKFEAFLDREARAYNAPPAEVPRDAMWSRIAEARAARQASAAASVVAPVVSPVGAMPQRRGFRYAPWMGMAATLLLGVGIGRYALQSGASDVTTAPAQVASGVSTPVVGESTATVGAPELRTDAPAAPTSDRAPRGTAVQYAPNARTAAQASVTPMVREAAPRRAPFTTTYQVASQQHLTRAEALVAVVAAMPRDAMMDSLTARWAKDVLTNTRLLLDSPAGDDPVRRRLLEDLETVLVQLVQRSGRATEDRDMLDRTLENTQLLTRLRTGAAGT